jgi:hypothetical protein
VTISPEPTDSQPDPTPTVDLSRLSAWLDTSEKYGRETVTLPVTEVRSLLAEAEAWRHFFDSNGAV